MLDKELLKYISGKRKYIVFIVISNVIGLILNVCLTGLLLISIKNFIELESNEGLLFLLFTIIIAIIKILFSYISSYFSNKLADYVLYKLREDTYSKFIKLRGNTLFTVSEMTELSTEGIEQLRLYYSIYLPSFFYAMIAPILLFVLFMFIDISVSIIYLVCVPLIPISIMMVSKWAKKIFNKYWDQYTSLGDSFLDNTKGMKELKIFLYDEKRQKEMEIESEEFRKITMKVLTMQLASVTIMDLVAYFGAAIGIVLSLNSFRNGLDLYLSLFMILMGAEFFLPLRALGSSFHVAMNGATAFKKVIKLLDCKDNINGEITINSINNITFRNVDFSYENRMILDNINLVLNKGVNSIVGLSGGGKSTIAKLCINSLFTNNGQILVNDINISDINMNSFYKRACYISNNTYIFNRSIRESFLFYNKNITVEKMKELLNLVKLELDIDLVINDSLSNLSGGEKQRLALVLYLANDYDFYIFDEVTSNIDSESEEIIMNIIKSLAKDKIILLISHRLKNVVGLGNIYYLEDGKIVEQGDSNYLLSMEARFKKLYLYQLELEEIKYERA